MGRESFMLYKAFYEPLKTLTNEQKGRLLTAIFEYQISKKEIQLDDAEQMAFMFIKNQFRVDDAKYENVVQRNRMNALGRLKTQAHPVDTEKDKDKEKDKEKDKDKKSKSLRKLSVDVQDITSEASYVRKVVPYIPLEDSWTVSPNIFDICVKNGLSEEAVQQAVQAYIHECNRRQFRDQDNDLGFVYYLKRFLLELEAKGQGKLSSSEDILQAVHHIKLEAGYVDA